MKICEQKVWNTHMQNGSSYWLWTFVISVQCASYLACRSWVDKRSIRLSSYFVTCFSLFSFPPKMLLLPTYNKASASQGQASEMTGWVWPRGGYSATTALAGWWPLPTGVRNTPFKYGICQSDISLTIDSWNLVKHACQVWQLQNFWSQTFGRKIVIFMLNKIFIFILFLRFGWTKDSAANFWAWIIQFVFDILKFYHFYTCYL